MGGCTFRAGERVSGDLPPGVFVSKRLLIVASAIGATIAAVIGASMLVTGGGSSASGDATPVATASPSLPLRTESVPAPSKGSAKKEVPRQKLKKVSKVPIDGVAKLPGGVTVSLKPLTVQKVAAVGPGDKGGRSIIVTVTVTNRSDSKVNLDSSWVQLTYGVDRQVAALQPADPYDPLRGNLARGESMSGTYPFAIGKADPGRLTVLVTYDPRRPRASFTGDLT